MSELAVPWLRKEGARTSVSVIAMHVVAPRTVAIHAHLGAGRGRGSR